MNLTLRQLQAFLAVAELGSFTRASERLRVTQSALSVMVADLERSLHLRLFDRTTRRVELTDAGRQFGASAAKAVADLDHAVRNAHLMAERRQGRVTIAAPPLLAAMLLPGAIARHRGAYPGIEINLIDAATDQILARLTSGEADLAVGTFPADAEGIERVRLAHDRLMLFCPAGHPLGVRRRVAWRELRGHDVIALTRESGIRRLAEQSWQEAGTAIRPAYEVAHITTATALVEAGLGVAVLPSYALPRRARMVARRLVEPEVSRDIELVHLQDRAPSPAGASLAEMLAAEMRRRFKPAGRRSTIRPVQAGEADR